MVQASKLDDAGVHAPMRSFDVEHQTSVSTGSNSASMRSFGLGAVAGFLLVACISAVALSQSKAVHSSDQGHGYDFHHPINAFAPTGVFSRSSGPSRTATPEAKWNPSWKAALENPPPVAASAPAPAAAAVKTKGGEDFLEFSPYYDMSTMPNNVWKIKDPFEGKIISVDKIVGPDAGGETYDVVIDHGGDMPYIEGQSYGVIAPGVDAKGKNNKVRLYSIASSRYGDDQTGKTTTLCVKRATYWCPELKAEDPAKKGVCSNYLCDAKAGDPIKLTGPSGKVMLLPEDKPETDIIMVATGTGIAPMRSFVKRLFVDETPYAKDFKGLAWLFLGVANTDALLYDADWKKIAADQPDKFRYDVALSREQKNKDGGKMYIQDKVGEYADEIFQRLDNGAHIYFCGLKGMMPGIQDMLKGVAEAKGLNYDEYIKKLKKAGQWHVEVY